MSSSLAAVDKILVGKYPAKAHALKVANYVRSLHPEITDGLIYLESQKARLHEDCDQEVTFRQRRAFFYLTGCDIPDSYVAYRIAAKKLTLYIPPVDDEEVLWSGMPLTQPEAARKFDVDDVRLTTSDLESDLNIASAASTPTVPIFVIPDQISRGFSPAADGSLNITALKDAIDESRVTKDEYEVALIEKANLITAEAHHASMAAIKSASNEQEVYAVFTKECISRGAQTQAYHGIFGAGRAAATLHYVHNNAPLKGKLNLLLDAGAEVKNYASDVTRTFPISGEFSKESKEIYDIVLRMQREALAVCGPGKNWDDVHMLVHRVLIEGLLGIGLLRNGTVEQILEARTSTAFLPHGLGHYLGMDTHDTGGHRDLNASDPLFKYLRKRGPLPVGAVITVEPGLYFCEYILKSYLEDEKHSKYINKELLEKYWDVGGVRIEDNILITDYGYRNLTNAQKEVGDIYKIINNL